MTTLQKTAAKGPGGAARLLRYLAMPIFLGLAGLALYLYVGTQDLDSIEQLQFLSIVKDEWTAENGFLTPTLKIKRGKIEYRVDRYGIIHGIIGKKSFEERNLLENYMVVVDELLKAKLRGSGLEPYVEVVAHIDTEAEKRLVPLYRLET